MGEPTQRDYTVALLTELLDKAHLRQPYTIGEYADKLLRNRPGTLLECPFCKDTNFDGIGLKYHLEAGHCEPYEATPTIPTRRSNT